jgi:hypothetical protein
MVSLEKPTMTPDRHAIRAVDEGTRRPCTLRARPDRSSGRSGERITPFNIVLEQMADCVIIADASGACGA